jgi:hypothetical protein
MATAIPMCYVLTARQAKRAGPKLEAGPEASAERSEGMMEARQGRDAAGGSMRSTTARPAIFLAGDAHAVMEMQRGELSCPTMSCYRHWREALVGSMRLCGSPRGKFDTVVSC